MDTRARDNAGSAVQLTRPLPRLYLVSDDAVVSETGFMERACAALAEGRFHCALQLRAHELTGERFCGLARRLRRATAETGSSLWINDRIDVAMAVRADGVQLGQRSIEPDVARRLLGRTPWIGCSVHSANEARWASADLMILGNIYRTGSHPGREPLGLDELRRATLGGQPIIAIGGITPQRVAEVVRSGAWGVAVLSGVWRASDPAEAVREYLSAIDAAVIHSAASDRAEDD